MEVNKIKHIINSAITYMIFALISGVFFREFTKLYSYSGSTTLSLLHGHYFTLGLFLMLFLVILEKQFNFLKITKVKKYIIIYHIGLNITGLMLLLRGITKIVSNNLSSSLDASISGLSGLGHILLSYSFIMMFLKIKKVIVKG